MKLEDGAEVHADVLVGADGIWSQVRLSQWDYITYAKKERKRVLRV